MGWGRCSKIEGDLFLKVVVIVRFVFMNSLFRIFRENVGCLVVFVD